MGQRIDHADLGDQPRGVMERHDHHARSEADARRLARHARHHHQRRGTDAVIAEMVLGEPGDGEAGLLGGLHLRHRFVIDRRGRRAARAIPHQAEQADIHGALPCPVAGMLARERARLKPMPCRGAPGALICPPDQRRRQRDRDRPGQRAEP
jgi:hypothetical protein